MWRHGVDLCEWVRACDFAAASAVVRLQVYQSTGHDRLIPGAGLGRHEKCGDPKAPLMWSPWLKPSLAYDPSNTRPSEALDRITNRHSNKRPTMFHVYFNLA